MATLVTTLPIAYLRHDLNLCAAALCMFFLAGEANRRLEEEHRRQGWDGWQEEDVRDRGLNSSVLLFC